MASTILGRIPFDEDRIAKDVARLASMPVPQEPYRVGVFGLGHGLAEGVSPAVMSALPLALGLPGWLVLATLLLVAGLACHPLLTRVSRTATRSAG
ncbi:hypothetical protein ABZ297_36760 [Nonomuraea sp. NPDC005983]|uniref:hypothetical protein n=1 Tax=Nonomuraea sp. NPDC005983 TaxID=3155595 RepID=UPI00339F53C4